MFLLCATLSYSRDYHLCFHLIDKSPSTRFHASDRIGIFDSSFLTQTSSSPGGAIFINQTSAILEVASCLFFKCSSLGVATFISRTCSGGSICCNSLYSEIARSDFESSFGASAGTVFFVIGSPQQLMKFEECSASKTSCQLKESITWSGNVAIMIDTSSSSFTKVNISYPKSFSHSVFFGFSPSFLKVKNVIIAGPNNERGIEFSSTEQQNNISSIHFVDVIATQGIFAVWFKEFAVADVHVAKSKGKLVSQYDNGKLIVSKSWIGNNINVDTDVAILGNDSFKDDSPLVITSIILNQYYNICSKKVFPKRSLLLSILNLLNV